MSACLVAALDHSGSGRPVFPLHNPTPAGCSCHQGADCPPSNRGKHPRFVGWQAEATTDTPTIQRWYRRWPLANIGIPTGQASGFIVLDIDPRHGGDDTLRALEATHGALPTTPASLTGGGGVHYLFRHPGSKVPNKASIADGIDVRGDGGLIVAPGSVHASGRTYLWDAGAHPDDTPLAELPDWLAAMIFKQRPAATGGTLPDVIGEGARNETLFHVGYNLRKLGLVEAEITAMLLTLNGSRCAPALTEPEVAKIAASAATYERTHRGRSEVGQRITVEVAE